MSPSELTRYCPTCEEEQRVIETVPWQDDLCEECRHSIPDGEDA